MRARRDGAVRSPRPATVPGRRALLPSVVVAVSAVRRDVVGACHAGLLINGSADQGA